MPLGQTMPDSDPIRRAFGIVANEHTRLLILGSFPGEQSLKVLRYYANPRNQFWQLMTPVVGIDLGPLPYLERLSSLLEAGIGLWDVVATARRKGSLDSAIRDAEARDLNDVLATLPALRTLAFNGKTAFNIGVSQLGSNSPVELIALPSSSSAHAIGIRAKQPAWTHLSAHLGKSDHDASIVSRIARRKWF